jgi:hypothetical protein
LKLKRKVEGGGFFLQNPSSHQIQHHKIGVLGARLVTAICYAFVVLAIAPFLLLGSPDGRSAATMIMMLFMYPVMCFVFTVLGALIYNLAARFTDGFELQISLPPDSTKQLNLNAPQNRGILERIFL